MRLRHNENFRVSDDEHREIARMAKEWGVPRSEVWRRLLLTVRVLYDSDLMLSDVLKIDDKTFEIHQLLAEGHDLPLHEAMRPVPQLADILRAKETLSSLARSKEGLRGGRRPTSS
jgi:hypothetical protein